MKSLSHANIIKVETTFRPDAQLEDIFVERDSVEGQARQSLHIAMEFLLDFSKLPRASFSLAEKKCIMA